MPETPRTTAKFTPADLATRGIFQILWRRQLVLFLSVIVCVATAIVYITQATPIFSSSARIVIDNSTPPILSQILGTTGTGMNYLSTQCDVITSTPIVTQAVGTLNTQQMPSLANVENAVGFIRSTLTASVGRTSDIITVTFESPYPNDCAAVVNAVVGSYIDNQNQKRQNMAGGLLKILKESYEKSMADRALLSQAIKTYREANPRITLQDERTNVVVQKLMTLSDALVKQQLEVVDAKSTYENAKALMSDPLKVQQFIIMRRESGVGQAGAYSNEMQDLEAQRRLLEARGIGADATVMKTLQVQMEILKERMSAAEKRYVESYVAAAQQSYLAAQAKMDELSKTYDEQRDIVVQVNNASQQLLTMLGDLDRTNKFMDSLDTKMKEINVNNQDSTNVNIQILETAKPDNNPIRPKRVQVLGISILVGVMMGFGAALMQDWMDQRLRSVDEISAALQLPILGVVPHITGGKTAMARGMEVHVEPMSEVSEAYRTIRTAVYFGVPEGQDNTVLVTSPAPGDGKTTMASNLAIAMAQAGHTVLLIDCDFRRPRQHRIFGLKDDVGLSSVLAGQHTLTEAVQATAVPNMSLLPCGPIPNNPSEILNSQVFADTLEELKGKFDHVVIDSPPVNPVTDARILAASADVTIIVVRADKSTRKLSENARESLLGVGANILGVVVNDAPRSGRGYGGYGYGYYSDRLYRDRTSKSGSRSKSANGAAGTPEKNVTRM